MSKSSPGYPFNLIDREILIDNPEVISHIKSMIINSKQGIPHTMKQDWEVLLTLYLSNGKEIDIKLEKIIGKSNKSKIAMYFLFGSCNDDSPRYSNDLGKYLEELTNYNGVKKE